jgi:hypothetical protein
MVVGSLIVFAVSLLIGAVGIYAGGRVVAGVDSYAYAIITALIGAIVWGLSGFLFGWIPLLGPILVFIAYLAVINWRYPGGWGDALFIALIAWVVVLTVLYALAVVGVVGFDAAGVPGA